MNKASVADSLMSMGWRIETDGVGDKVAFYDLADRIVDIIPNVRCYGDKQQLSAMKSLSSTSFSAACQRIRCRGGSYTPMIRAMKSFRIAAPEILDEHVRQMSVEAISWAKEQDLDIGLQELAVLPTTAPGARPVWHLGALAVLGEVDTLKFYQVSFDAGDRLGFVDYVTKDYIDRAVVLADQSAMGT